MSLTFTQLQQRFEAGFLPEKAAGLDALFQYVVPDGSNFFMRVAGGALDLSAGDAATTADLTITLEWQTLEQLLAGELSSMQAFMFGHIKVQGSLSLASRLIELFSTDPQY